MFRATASDNRNFIRQVRSILKLCPKNPPEKVCGKFSPKNIERFKDKTQSLTAIHTGSKRGKLRGTLICQARSLQMAQSPLPNQRALQRCSRNKFLQRLFTYQGENYHKRLANTFQKIGVHSWQWSITTCDDLYS